MLGDGVGDSPKEDSCFVHAYDNVVLDTVNYGIAISAGHDNRIDRNRVISAGVLETGQRIAAQNVGIYIWDSYKAGRTHFFNNRGSDNVVGWVTGSSGKCWWIPAEGEWQGHH